MNKFILDVKNIYRTRYGQRGFAGNFRTTTNTEKITVCANVDFLEKEKHTLLQNNAQYMQI